MACKKKLDMEILFDPKGEAVHSGLAIGDEHEICPDGEWIQYARRETGIKDLFVYFHKRTGNWVFAKWLYKPSETDTPVALELEAMPLPPDMPGSGRLVGGELTMRCAPVEEMMLAMKRKLQKAASEKASVMADRGTSRDAAVKYMRKKGMERGAAMLDSGAVGWNSPNETSDQYKETVSQLIAMAKGNH